MFSGKTKKDPAWKLTYEHFRPAEESLRETLCTLGNGYMGTRGASASSSASRIHYPGTYIAGVYDKLPTPIAGRTILNEDLVNCPNWLSITFKIGEEGVWVTPSTGKVVSYNQELDMKKGVLSKKVLLQDRLGRRTLVQTERFVHMAEPHRAAIRYTLTPMNYKGWIFVRNALDGTVENSGVARYRQLASRHLRLSELGNFSNNGIFLSVKTVQSDIMISMASRLRIFTGGREKSPKSGTMILDKKMICQEFKVHAGKKQKYTFEKNVSVYTSKDRNVRKSLRTAIKSVKHSKRFDALLDAHAAEWARLWKDFDIKVDGDAFSQQALRLHAFHLLQTASRHNTDIDAGLPARGLHGESYRGHIFWDELYVMPFFDLRAPEISRALLMYRYRRLARARDLAGNTGYKGAMFPWQSGSSGEEETQVLHLNPLSGKWGPDYSHLQRHVSFAIAYNCWHYWKRTGDLDFMVKYGAEMLLSIAQFGASLVKFDPVDKRYHTAGLMGPDEFHEKLPGSARAGFRDNAYTNFLIAWTLERAREALELLPKKQQEKLLRKLSLPREEISAWRKVSRGIKIIFSRDGVIEQFAGYFGLKELDWDAYRRKYSNIKRMDRILKAEGRSPDEYKASKQADVLMIFYLFPFDEAQRIFEEMGYGFTRNLLKKNYDYYLKRTSHGSTLSKVVHCYLSHLLGRSREAWQWYMEVMKSDIYDTQGGTTPEGIHAGVMGGSIDIAIRGFAGVSLEKDILRINPSLPDAWNSVRLAIHHGRVRFSLFITKKHIKISAGGRHAKGVKFPVRIGNALHRVPVGGTRKFQYKRTI